MIHEVLPDGRGQVEANRAVSVVVSVLVAALLASFLLPIAVSELVAVDTSSWASSAAQLWNLLDVMIVLAIFLFFTKVALRAR